MQEIINKYKVDNVETKQWAQDTAKHEEEFEAESAYERIRAKYLERQRSPSPAEELNTSIRSHKSQVSRRSNSADKKSDLGASVSSLPPLGMSQDLAETLKSPTRSPNKKSGDIILPKAHENKNLTMDKFVRNSMVNFNEEDNFERDSDGSEVRRLLMDDEPRYQSPEV